MKIFYRICKVCSFLFFIIILSSVSVFVLKKPYKAQKVIITTLLIDEYVVEKKETLNQTTFYLNTEKEISKKEAVSVAFLIYDIENKAISLLVESKNHYYQVAVSNNFNASIVVSNK